MIKVYWKLSSKRIFYGIQVPHFIIQSVSHPIKDNKRFERRAKSIFFIPFLVDMEETDLDVIDLPSFEITEEEFVRWLGMLGTDNVRSMDDLGWLLRLKKKHMKVGWSGIKYKKDGRRRIYYRFKVYTDSGDVILSAASIIDGIRCNKRRWKPDRIFWKADQYYEGDQFPSLIFPHSYFEIDPEKLEGIKIKDNL